MAGPSCGSAEVMFGSRRPAAGLRLSCPFNKEIRKGTLAGILRDADLSADELRRLLG